MKVGQPKKYNQKQARKINLFNQKKYDRLSIYQSCCILENPQQWKTITIKKLSNKNIGDRMEKNKLNIMSLLQKNLFEQLDDTKDSQLSAFKRKINPANSKNNTISNISNKISNQLAKTEKTKNCRKFIQLSLIKKQDKIYPQVIADRQFKGQQQVQEVQNIKRQFFEYLNLYNNENHNNLCKNYDNHVNERERENCLSNHSFKKYNKSLNSIQEVQKRFQTTEENQIVLDNENGSFQIKNFD